MKRKIPVRAAGLVFGFVAALAFGCDSLDFSEGSPSSPSDPVTILIGGQCRAVGRSIECEDESRSIPSNQLRIIEWVLRNARTGDRLESRSAGPGDEISFPGLANDPYQVTQRVSAKDGGSDQKVHNLSIPGPF